LSSKAGKTEGEKEEGDVSKALQFLFLVPFFPASSGEDGVGHSQTLYLLSPINGLKGWNEYSKMLH
jgi:hypothetical protein